MSGSNPSETPIPRRRTFPASRRIHARLDFERAFEGRCKSADSLLVLYVAANGLAWPRLGIVASRRLGNAPQRNRLKRLLREAFRHLQHELPPGLDVVCVLKAADRPTLAEYQESILKLVKRAHRRLVDQL